MIDRDFEQVSEEHMKSMTKPAQEPQGERIVCDNCEGQGGFDGAEGGECRDCCGEGYISVPATPAPSQPAGAREFIQHFYGWDDSDMTRADIPRFSLNQAVELCHVYATQQTAAKDAEIDRLRIIETTYECHMVVMMGLCDILGTTDVEDAAIAARR